MSVCGVCALTDGVFGWQVDGVCVQVFQEGAVNQVGELVNLNGRLIRVVQQSTEMLAPGRGARRQSLGLRRQGCP